MRKMHQLKLIDGEFSAQDAKEVLMSLFSSKLNFHQLKDFSSIERFGKVDETAKKRIPELKETMKTVSVIIQDAVTNKKNLIITATVNVECTSRN